MSRYTLSETIKLYEEVGNRNGDFLFNWIKNIYDFFYLPSIDLNFKEVLALDKTKLTIFDVLVDDLADNCKLRNRELLEKAIRIPWNGTKTYNNKYLDITQQIWVDCIKSIRQYPKYNEFKDIFYFDLDKTLSSMKYSFLINQAGFDNIVEDEIYIQHGVMAILHADLDLMCSPGFNYEELKKLRPILHWVQNIVHIGNLMNTFAREVEEADFSSPILSFAFRERIIDKQMILDKPEQALNKLKQLVPYFKEKAEDNFQKIKFCADAIESIDIHDYYRKLRKVWNEFLERKQYWKPTLVVEEKRPVIISKPLIALSIPWVRM